MLVALLCGAVQIFTLGIPETEGFIATAKQLYYSERPCTAAGWPQGCRRPSSAPVRQAGASITICLLIFVFVMVITGGTLIDLYQSAAQPVKKLEEPMWSGSAMSAAAPIQHRRPVRRRTLARPSGQIPKGSMDRSGVSKAKEKAAGFHRPTPLWQRGRLREEPASHKLDASCSSPSSAVTPSLRPGQAPQGRI